MDENQEQGGVETRAKLTMGCDDVVIGDYLVHAEWFDPVEAERINEEKRKSQDSPANP